MISGETMSIFEPIPRGSRWDDEDEDDGEDDDLLPARGFLDPRSIRIGGAVVAGIVVLGLFVANRAERDPGQRPLVPSVQVDPGAAAVEQVDVSPSAPPPTTGPSPSPTTEPVDSGDAPSWQQPDDSRDDGFDDREFRRSKGDDKPGNGNGRGRGRD